MAAALLAAVGAAAESPVVLVAGVVAPLVLHLLAHQPLVPPAAATAEARGSRFTMTVARAYSRASSHCPHRHVFQRWPHE